MDLIRGGNTIIGMYHAPENIKNAIGTLKALIDNEVTVQELAAIGFESIVKDYKYVANSKNKVLDAWTPFNGKATDAQVKKAAYHMTGIAIDIATVSVTAEQIVKQVKANRVSKCPISKDINKGTPKTNSFNMNKLDSFKNAKITDVEKYLDNTLEGFTKAPLKKGDGVRYFDGKGNSYQLNYGYKNASDAVHGGPYLKTTSGSEIIRIPLTK